MSSIDFNDRNRHCYTTRYSLYCSLQLYIPGLISSSTRVTIHVNGYAVDKGELGGGFEIHFWLAESSWLVM